jgi:hypothetical protein
MGSDLQHPDALLLARLHPGRFRTLETLESTVEGLEMKYSRYVFIVTSWPNPSEDMVETTVVVELTSDMTEAMRIAIEDWDSSKQGEIRTIAVKDIKGIERPDE